MIGHINQTGKYLSITGGPGSNYVNINNIGSMGVGQLQFNTTNQQLEVYNGTSWQKLNLGTYYAGLTPHAEMILDWAHEKMREEKELERLAKDSVAIKDLVEQIKQKQNQIKMVRTLIKKETMHDEFQAVQTGP